MQELPSSERARAATAGRKVQFLLVSLDRRAQLDKKVKPFVRKHGLQSEVVLLNEPNLSTWLANVDSRWSGSIPFTRIFNNQVHLRTTFAHSLSTPELTAARRHFLQ